MTSKNKQYRMAAIVAALFTLTILCIACGDDGGNPPLDKGIADTTKNDGITADSIKPDTVTVCTLPDVILHPKTVGKEQWSCNGPGLPTNQKCFFIPKLYENDGITCLMRCVPNKGSETAVFSCIKSKISVPAGSATDKFTCEGPWQDTYTCE